jgi:hypothetical protein
VNSTLRPRRVNLHPLDPATRPALSVSKGRVCTSVGARIDILVLLELHLFRQHAPSCCGPSSFRERSDEPQWSRLRSWWKPKSCSDGLRPILPANFAPDAVCAPCIAFPTGRFELREYDTDAVIGSSRVLTRTYPPPFAAGKPAAGSQVLFCSAVSKTRSLVE